MRFRCSLMLFASFLIGAPVAFAAGEARNVLRFHVGYFIPTGEYTWTYDGGLAAPREVTAKYEDSFGAGIAYERRFSDLFGLHVGLDYYKPDATGAPITGLGGSGSGSFVPLAVGAMFHVTKSKSFDVYLGPELAYVNYGDLELKSPTGAVLENIVFKDDLVFGARLGFDAPFGGGWAFSAVLEHLAAQAEVDRVDVFVMTDGAGSGSEAIKYDPKPIIVKLGVSRRF